MTNKIDLDGRCFYDLDCSLLSAELLRAAENCIHQQKIAAAALCKGFNAVEPPLDIVSPEALNEILESGEDVHGVSNEPSISNAITFGFGHIEDSVHDETVQTTRAEVDRRLSRELGNLFDLRVPPKIMNSGHIWYPKGSHMGWHTNSLAPGLRIYINYAEEPGKSFFRYRDPETGEIITAWDKQWNLRVLRITRDNPLWHCVYADTNRFSLGWMVIRQRPRLARIATEIRMKLARAVSRMKAPRTMPRSRVSSACSSVSESTGGNIELVRC
jgi:hypothetical protein